MSCLFTLLQALTIDSSAPIKLEKSIAPYSLPKQDSVESYIQSSRKKTLFLDPCDLSYLLLVKNSFTAAWSSAWPNPTTYNSAWSWRQHIHHSTILAGPLLPHIIKSVRVQAAWIGTIFDHEPESPVSALKHIEYTKHSGPGQTRGAGPRC